ncbi:MAG: bifunctional UDP-N-acetylglucosamine diphosphorylase/glucosamine-1-phosphate N-acetyltransferase GlmU [Lachnospiraceae bacterium]|nr:bifunctional UDP-N-acetylglucosamine diphosphorylase/glucosamine-1-phosphate N-acetyltransferase GlmU [Lachnospiraceae bacterium]
MLGLKAIILAAGEGKRMKSSLPKVLHSILGRPMLFYVIDAARGAGASDICVILGHGADAVKEALKDTGVSFSYQKEQLGTGHAVMQAGSFIEDGIDYMVLYGDTPLLKEETLVSLLGFHRQNSNSVSLVSTFLDEPFGYGRIIRKGGDFEKIVEEKDTLPEEKLIKEVNAGVYCFNGSSLKSALSKLKNNNSQNEYYLTDTVEILKSMGEKVSVMPVLSHKEFNGVNSRSQLANAAYEMKKTINAMHMDNGVTLIDPETTYIDFDVEIGEDTVIKPGCLIESGTKIGEGCVIGPYCQLTNMAIGDNVNLKFTMAMDSKIGSGANIGPYAYIRPNCDIGENVKIGDFVEVKNSVIDKGTKVPHLTYVGDADIGKNTNLGCGTITVNYDGKIKHRTIVEDNVFIGCNTNLVAPVRVCKNSYIAAGSTITHDVPEDSLAIARARQVDINGWTKKQ